MSNSGIRIVAGAHMFSCSSPLGTWWEGGKPGSEVTLEVGRRRVRTKWVGSGGAAETGEGTLATRASVGKAVEFGVGNAKLARWR